MSGLFHLYFYGLDPGFWPQMTYAVSKVFIPGHEDDEEADHEAGDGHGEGGKRTQRQIFGQKVGEDSGNDG